MFCRPFWSGSQILAIRLAREIGSHDGSHLARDPTRLMQAIHIYIHIYIYILANLVHLEKWSMWVNLHGVHAKTTTWRPPALVVCFVCVLFVDLHTIHAGIFVKMGQMWVCIVYMDCIWVRLSSEIHACTQKSNYFGAAARNMVRCVFLFKGTLGLCFERATKRRNTYSLLCVVFCLDGGGGVPRTTGGISGGGGERRGGGGAPLPGRVSPRSCRRQRRWRSSWKPPAARWIPVDPSADG